MVRGVPLPSRVGSLGERRKLSQWAENGLPPWPKTGFGAF